MFSTSYYPRAYSHYDIDPYELAHIRAEQRRREELVKARQRQAQREQAELEYRRKLAARAERLSQRQTHTGRPQLVGYDYFGRPVFRRVAPERRSESPEDFERIPVQSEWPTESAVTPANVSSDRAVEEIGKVSETESSQISIEKQNEAAHVIQSAWRQAAALKRGLKQLEPISESFQSMTSLMSFPASPVFDDNGNFAYASINVPILAYVEELEKLLLKLDAVESGGVKQVKEARRQLVKAIEAELERVDQWKAEIAAGKQSTVAGSASIATEIDAASPERETEGSSSAMKSIPESVASLPTDEGDEVVIDQDDADAETVAAELVGLEQAAIIKAGEAETVEDFVML